MLANTRVKDANNVYYHESIFHLSGSKSNADSYHKLLRQYVNPAYYPRIIIQGNMLKFIKLKYILLQYKTTKQNNDISLHLGNVIESNKVLDILH